MNVETIRDYCMKKLKVTEELPFGDDILVFKVCGKVFLLFNLNNADSINLKCDPEEAIKLREEHSEIIPGYHMNKKHWNTVYISGNLKDQFILKMIDDSYRLVVSRLPKKIRENISL